MQPAYDSDITGIILAGGRARRMDGADKGLLALAGRPMVAHVLERLAPQVGRVAINANRNQAAYRGFGVPVFGDRMEGFPGPLAGIAAALAEAQTELVAVVPCDVPLLPVDLVARLRRALRDGPGEIAVAADGHRMQTLCALLRRDLRASLERALAAGERRVDRWYAGHRTLAVDLSDCPGAFANVNSRGELAMLEHQLSVETGDAG